MTGCALVEQMHKAIQTTGNFCVTPVQWSVCKFTYFLTGGNGLTMQNVPMDLQDVTKSPAATKPMVLAGTSKHNTITPSPEWWYHQCWVCRGLALHTWCFSCQLMVSVSCHKGCGCTHTNPNKDTHYHCKTDNSWHMRDTRLESTSRQRWWGLEGTLVNESWDSDEQECMNDGKLTTWRVANQLTKLWQT